MEKEYEELYQWYFYLELKRKHDKMRMLSYPILTAERGVPVEIIISFWVSVMASVASYCICKWLDENDNDN